MAEWKIVQKNENVLLLYSDTRHQCNITLTAAEALTMFDLIENGKNGRVKRDVRVDETDLLVDFGTQNSEICASLLLPLGNFPQYRLEESAKEAQA